MKNHPKKAPPPAHRSTHSSIIPTGDARVDNAPAFTSGHPLPSVGLRQQIGEACQAWLLRSPSAETRAGYSRELKQFLRFAGVAVGAWEQLATVRPSQVAAWRDDLLARGQSNTAVSRKLSVLRSLYG